MGDLDFRPNDDEVVQSRASAILPAKKPSSNGQDAQENGCIEDVRKNKRISYKNNNNIVASSKNQN
jgi:hypothetical protein